MRNTSSATIAQAMNAPHTLQQSIILDAEALDRLHQGEAYQSPEGDHPEAGPFASESKADCCEGLHPKVSIVG